MDVTVLTYVAYLLTSLGITLWTAHVLGRHGRVFLVDVFGGDERLAHAVNTLLVAGFYLLNLGFVMLYLRIPGTVAGLRDSMDILSVKLGTVLLVLGGLHMLNLYVFTRLRRRAHLAPTAHTGYPNYPASTAASTGTAGQLP